MARGSRAFALVPALLPAPAVRAGGRSDTRPLRRLGLDRVLGLALPEGATSLEDFSAAVLAHLKAADVVHMDETPIRCATDPKAWIHVACTELLTLLHARRHPGQGRYRAPGSAPRLRRGGGP